VSRLPIRVRLTAAFALAMLVMLTCAALFVALRLRADLDDAVDAHLRNRAIAIADRQDPTDLAGVALEDPEESFARTLSAGGDVLDAVGTATESGLTRDEIERATRELVVVDRRVAGVDGTARVLARPAASRGTTVIVVVGQSLVDRNDALRSVVTSFTVGGIVAVLLASGTGYLLARAGLAPVEAMRRRARDVSLRGGDEGLPLPAAHDEVRRLGVTLNEMLRRLRDSFEREGRFVADASHELRTPIATIRTEIEGALRAGGHDPQVREALVAAVEECDRLAQLAEDLLVIARAGDGRLPVRTEPIAVRELLDGVRERFVDRAAQRGRAIRVQANEATVRADPVRLRQALGNLVDNALRHGAGDVTLRAGTQADRTVFDVSDCGPGFAPELADRAFERFARGDRSRSGDGAGLGLAIVRAIAEAHRGGAEIVATSPPTVRVWLPPDS
jgi:signal transduction histidine kinase